ncbi:DMT family transporter [Aminipila luticellarii]|uniref:DMT family transporter n=1 Tax=Aminipila luticellarii TaxID=2507160 RepID=A0A410PYA4_9FIRM|nr:DMT family transporter [Aminipila luticellarii]QAT43875.1 DMT family transporter [Aminipila luticellarii]
MNIFERNVKKVVILAVVAAAFSPIFVRLTSAPAMAIGFYRLAFALPVFAVMTLVRHREEALSMTKKQLGGCAVAGIFLAGHFFSWFTGIEHTSVASGSVLAMTDPFMILLISVFIFKEKTNKKAVAGVIVAFIGSVIISGSDYSISADTLFGDIMCLFAALFIGLYFIAGNKFRKGINAAVYVFFVFLFCWITFTIGMLVTGTPFTGYSANDMFWIFVMAMVCQIGAHAVFNWCLGYTSALYVATCENLETFISTGVAMVLFAEIPSIWQIVGGLTIVAGVMYYTRHEGDSNGI